MKKGSKSVKMSCTNCQGQLKIVSGYEVCDYCGDSQITYSMKTGYAPQQFHREDQIKKDFNAIPLPQKIRDDAVLIYLDVVGQDTLKRDRRKAMMCKCTYEAFISNNVARDPVMLTKLFDIDIKKLKKAQNDFYEKAHISGKKRKYPKIHLTAKQLLDEFLTLFGFTDEKASEDILELHEIIEQLYETSVLLERHRPRDISIAVAYWYYQKHGFVMLPEDVHFKFLIPKVTIIELINTINNLHM